MAEADDTMKHLLGPTGPLSVSDPAMHYCPPAVSLENMTWYLRPDRPTECFCKSTLLLWAGPGSGKTRLLRELVLAAAGQSPAVASVLQKHKCDLQRDFTTVAVALKADACTSAMDRRLCDIGGCLAPVYLRIVFAYCAHPYSRDPAGFTRMQESLLCACDRGFRVQCLRTVLEAIRVAHQRKYVLLLVDNSEHYIDTISMGLSEREARRRSIVFIEGLDSLHSVGQNRFWVIQTGLQTAPWNRVSVSADRPRITVPLGPIQFTTQSAQWILRCEGMQALLQEWRLLRYLRNNSKSAAQAAAFLFQCTGGHPGAVECVQNAIRASSGGGVTLVQLCESAAAELQSRYPIQADAQALVSALLGTVELELNNGVPALKEQVATGRCLLIPVEDSNTVLEVLIPPLRLTRYNFAEYPSLETIGQLAQLTRSTGPESVAHFHYLHEIALREYRRYAIQHNLPGKCDYLYSKCTVEEHYSIDHSIFETSYICYALPHPLGSTEFNFTVPLTRHIMPVDSQRRAHTFPSYKSARQYLNHAIIPGDAHKAGFSQGYIMESLGPKRTLVAIVEIVDLFRTVDASHDAAAVERALRKCVRVLCGDLHWPLQQVVVVFKSDRVKQAHLKVAGELGVYVVLLSDEGLERFLGPTLHSMFRACEAMSQML